MKVIASLLLVDVAFAGSCSADDQTRLSDPNDIGKKAGDCGKTAYNVLTGNFNHDKFNDCLTASAGISAACSECYAVSGEYGASNCKAACLLGWCKSGCLDCVKPAQADLDACTGFTSGSATPCMESTVGGACSADDQALLSDPNDIGKKAGDCGKTAYNVLTGNFNHDKFNDCLTASAGISAACSECYAVSGEYGASNCKAACLLGWCKSGCLDCVKPAQADLDACTGFTSGSATPCMESTVGGACSADDQALLSDPNDIGKKAGDCGKTAYNVLTGNFNHDKFNDCLTASAGISAGCSECYAVSGEYGASNCKAACLLGWCKSGCLDCVKPAQADLDACTGFASGSATPCMGSTVGGACSADDQALLSDPNDIGKKAGDCGKTAYNVLTGNFNHDKFNDCLTASAGISAACSECYAVSGEYGASNCKAACLLGWCKSGCLDCVKPAQADLDTCTGFTSGSADPCMEEVAV